MQLPERDHQKFRGLAASFHMNQNSASAPCPANAVQSRTTHFPAANLRVLRAATCLGRVFVAPLDEKCLTDESRLSAREMVVLCCVAVTFRSCQEAPGF